jgi:predicted ATPase
MRKPHLSDGGDRLRSDGANVTSVLERMMVPNESNRNPNERITDFLRAVNPSVLSVYTLRVDRYPLLRIEEGGGNDEKASWHFDASEASYGTLRTLGILVALYQGRMAGGSPVTLVGIEEPESAVHPGAATAILGAMTEASLVTQVLATTHSPAMLDDEHLDIDILRGVSRVNGRTIIGPINAGNREILEEQLYTAGELLRMGHLLPDEPPDGPVPRPVAAPV